MVSVIEITIKLFTRWTRVISVCSGSNNGKDRGYIENKEMKLHGTRIINRRHWLPI